MTRKVYGICFSPTGNTKKLTERIAARLAEAFGCPYELQDFTAPASREAVKSYAADELVVVGSPTYAGKLPNKILPDFKEKLRGEGTVCVPVVTYGNRSFDNSLAELTAVLKAGGFVPAGAAAFACRHAFSDLLAGDRPSAEDFAEADSFADGVAEKVRKAEGVLTGELAVAGDADAPYYVPKGLDGQPAKFLKAKPLTDPAKCTDCGKCVPLCPVGSIDPADVTNVPGICIKCQACVRGCPEGAKYFDDKAFLSHVAMLEQNFTEHKKNAFFL